MCACACASAAAKEREVKELLAAKRNRAPVAISKEERDRKIQQMLVDAQQHEVRMAAAVTTVNVVCPLPTPRELALACAGEP